MAINRREVVDRHRIKLTAPNPQHVLSVGNGDFACTVDISGMQSFSAYHDPIAAMRSGSVAINTATMSNWGWHEMPNPDNFTLADAMMTYTTARGPVSYPDKYDMDAAMRGQITEENRAGAWLHTNPQRIDLGRIGLEFRKTPGSELEVDPACLSDVRQELDMWTGTIESAYTYEGEDVQVRTVSSPDSASVAFQIISPLLVDGRARVQARFPYAHEGFFQTENWDAADRHHSTITATDGGVTTIERRLDGTLYFVTFRVEDGSIEPGEKPHEFVINTKATTLEIVVRFSEGEERMPLGSFTSVAAASARAWEQFWMSGAAIDFAAVTDARGFELERRAILSQYLTAVHAAGELPPQETGLVTNSWQGKFHLEMHFWHGAHFAAWGRPWLLEKSLRWYLSILPVARETAARQGYAGARWPKHVGPDGRESPSPIGALLVWQQPHILYLLELVWQASPEAKRLELVEEYAELVDATASFMGEFPVEDGGRFHLGPPVMPAQEFYDARTTRDPTFELAYWWWGLEVAQLWRERTGLERHAVWDDVQRRLALPRKQGPRYAAVDADVELRRDDHPSLVAALGVVPSTPIIDEPTMEATLLDVLDRWEWPSAWGWDFPMLAMTAARLGQLELAIEVLLRDEAKNQYSAVGHTPQIRSILPLYLPSNGAFLAALSLVVGVSQDSNGVCLSQLGRVRAEGFVPWPQGRDTQI